MQQYHRPFGGALLLVLSLLPVGCKEEMPAMCNGKGTLYFTNRSSFEMRAMVNGSDFGVVPARSSADWDVNPGFYKLLALRLDGTVACDYRGTGLTIKAACDHASWVCPE